jgi:hypothetical protein
MEKLVVEMKIIADGVVHHVAETFLYLQVWLAAVMAIFTFKRSAAVEAIVFAPVMFFHFLVKLRNNVKELKHRNLG